MVALWLGGERRPLLLSEVFMRPSYRKPVNKHRSAGKFRRSAGRTNGRNMKAGPMRGGIRL